MRFLSDFFDFFFINVFYLAYEIHVQNFVHLCCVVVEKCWKWVEISILWLLWISFIVSTLFACIWGFIIIKGVTNIYNIYKCYEHFNHKWLGFLFGMGWMARRAFGWCSAPFDNYKIFTPEITWPWKKNSESPIGKCWDTRDRWKMLMMAKKCLKYLAGNIQNINESKINLDS